MTAALAFSVDEYRARLTAVRERMEARGATLLIVDQVEHVGYLTGYLPRGTLYQACIVPLEGDPVMVTRSVDEGTFREVAWFSGFVAYGDAEDPVDVLRRLFFARSWQHEVVGLELDSNYLPVRQEQALRNRLPVRGFVDCSGVIRELRLIKSPHEIRYLREASRLADVTLAATVDAVHDGAQERELAAVAYATALRHGADNSWLAIITARPDSVHGGLIDRPLRRGDLVHMEFVPQVHGYSARLMRPTAVGEPTSQERDVARQLVEIQDRQLEAIRPGVPACDVDRVARDGVLCSGLRTRYDNVTGYTLGLIPGIGTPRTSDFTRVFLPSSEWHLEAGMVFHMYVLAQSLAFSESVLVTEQGCERLTQTPRQLFVH